jgi:hypothetical protein
MGFLVGTQAKTDFAVDVAVFNLGLDVRGQGLHYANTSLSIYLTLLEGISFYPPSSGLISSDFCISLPSALC